MSFCTHSFAFLSVRAAKALWMRFFHIWISLSTTTVRQKKSIGETHILPHDCYVASWYKFDKYYKLTDDTPIYAAAILLHPALRRGYLDRQWEKQASYIEPAIDSVRNMWKEFKTLTPMEACASVPEVDDFQRWRQQIYHHSSNQDEFERFINASYCVIF